MGVLSRFISKWSLKFIVYGLTRLQVLPFALWSKAFNLLDELYNFEILRYIRCKGINYGTSEPIKVAN
jgi:hypothetical protein